MHTHKEGSLIKDDFQVYPDKHMGCAYLTRMVVKKLSGKWHIWKPFRLWDELHLELKKGINVET